MRNLLFLAILVPGTGWAADADVFHPAGSMAGHTGTLQGTDPRLGAPGPSVGLFTWLAEDPAVIGFADGSEQPILGSVFGSMVYGGWTVDDVVRLEAYVPLYPYAEAPLNEFEGPALGDIEFRALVPLADAGEAFALSVEPMLAVPTGTEDAWLGRGFHGGLYAVMGGRLDAQLGWVGELGIVGAERDELEGVAMGSSFDALAGVWYDVEPEFRVGADAFFTAGLPSGFQRHALFTAHAFAQVASSNGIALTVGGGGGLGVGAPEYRVFAGITWAQLTEDADRDGIVDDADDCPRDKEDVDGFEDDDGCPDDDNDGDTVSDAADECPEAAEDLDGFADGDGCPDTDNDGDGIDDPDDRCPDDAGPAVMAGCPDPDEDGVSNADDACPEEAGSVMSAGCPDADGDLVPDFRDACPDQPAPEEADPEFSDGCDAEAYVSAEGVITIKDRIHFDEGSAALRPDVLPILERVAAILLERPEIDLLEVAGHTDNTGDPDANQVLSDQRAEAVALYLADQGIPHRRLMPRGYGQTDPVDTNRTSSGRANNRRIEFVIRRWATEEPTEPGPPEQAVEPPAAPEPTQDVWR